jgi:hypothetical protein
MNVGIEAGDVLYVIEVAGIALSTLALFFKLRSRPRA